MTQNKNIEPSRYKMDGLLKTVHEIQSSNRVMLKRLNDIFYSSDGQCSCCRTQDVYLKDVGELQTKMNSLGNIVEEKNKTQIELNERLLDLKGRTDRLEHSLMTVQTDDSKLRTAQLKREQTISKQETSVKPKLEKEVKFNVDQSEKESHMLKTENVKSGLESTDVNEAPSLSAESLSATNKSKTRFIDTEKENQAGLTEKLNTNTVLKENNRESNNAESSGNGSKRNKNFQGAAQMDQQTERFETLPSSKHVEVIEQPLRKTYGGEQYWRFLAQQECATGNAELENLEGVHTVICLDISASMAEENAWTEASTFVLNYIIGLEEMSSKHGITNEHVALVTFGHETKVQKRLTNRYSEIRQLVENVRLGGPSPLYGGLVYSIAACGASDHVIEIVNNVQVLTKVIILTDLRLTEVGQYEGPDAAVENLDETRVKILQCVEEFKPSHMDTFFVPVGKLDKEMNEFLDLFLAVTEGRKLSFKSGRQFARRTYLTTKIVDPLGIMGESALSYFRSDHSELSAEDKRMIDEIKSDSRRNMFSSIDRDSNKDKYQEMKDSLPVIGSRVRRGPDWKWNMQDSNGPGTVIGHTHGEQVYVEWDADGHTNAYRYGKRGYDILIVEEPRQLLPGQTIAVGCIVKPGKDWTQSAGKGQFYQRGVVVKLDEPKAIVRWENGTRGEYSCGFGGKCEVEVCSESVASHSEGYSTGSMYATSKPVEKRTRNKNKNVH